MFLFTYINWFIYRSAYLSGQSIDKLKFEICRSEIVNCYHDNHTEQNVCYKSKSLTIGESGFLRFTLMTAGGKTEF
jgi:hypothetical protein